MTKATDKQYAMTLADKMDMVRMGIRAVTREYKISRLITGTVGIGKSYTVLDELRQEQKEFVHITGGIKDSKALYITLCKYNKPDLIIVFDDVNDILRRRQNIEILRAAVTNEPERQVSYFESKLLIDGIKSYHPRIVFKSKVIIVTNIHKSKIDPAIVSRTSPIEILANKYDMAPYIEANMEQAPPTNVPLAWKKEALHYIMKEVGLKNIKHLDFRVFEDVLLWKAASMTDKNSDPQAWKKFAYSILC